ncbi:MAG: biopolymer transporter ExbD [Treponema sp.]|jgi:biopolymer transport protein ExbD|nr:biopolymer transporter ExbD [Treponema sp.]
MKIKRLKKHSILESSSASDVAFLLIIYFIVIAGFNINKGFLINLPAKNSTRLILKEDLLRFEMDSSGRIIYKDDAINISSAQSLISGAQKNNPNIAVLIAIDRQARWQNVVSFVELVQDMKVDSFSFTMKKDSP